MPSNYASTFCDSDKLLGIFAGSPFLRFSLHLDDENWGSVDFSGDIPLLRPLRRPVGPDSVFVQEVAEKLIGFGRALWPDEEDELILSRLKDTAFVAGLLGGFRGGDDEPHFKLWASTLVLIGVMDDETDAQSGRRDTCLIYKQIAEMCRSTDTVLDHPLPALTTTIARVASQVEELKTQLATHVPRFREKFDVSLRHELYWFFASHAVRAELTKGGLAFSDSHSRALLRYTGGWYMGVEMLLILRGVEPPAEVRQSVTFGLVRNSISDIGMLANSLFGLPRDLRLGQEDSSIMQDVQNGRSCSLAEAINKTCAELLDALTDFKLLTQLLLTTYAYEGHKNVESYVQIVRGYVDGILLGYKFWDRYGVSDKLTLFEK